MNATGSIVWALVTLCAIHSAFGFLEPVSLLTRPTSSLRPSSASSFAKAGNLRFPVDHEAKHECKARGVRSLSATIPSDLKGKARLEKFMDDCALLGPMRFVCMTDATILEAVGSFENLRHSDQKKGRFATVSTVGFECHINTDKIKNVHMLTKKNHSGEYDLYITRFLDEAGATVLSAMLDGEKGNYEPGATEYWEKLRTNFGAEQLIAE